MLPKLTLVLGGVASGKSSFAEDLTRACGLNRLYLATAEAHDEDMAAKIARHQKIRGDGWTTLEEPLEIAPHFQTANSNDVILLDCATLWLTNLLLGNHDVPSRSAALFDAITVCKAPVVVVSNEVGGGGIAASSLARRFATAQGVLNQQFALRADLVVTVTAGLPLALKGAIPQAVS